MNQETYDNPDIIEKTYNISQSQYFSHFKFVKMIINGYHFRI